MAHLLFGYWFSLQKDTKKANKNSKLMDSANLFEAKNIKIGNRVS